MTQVSYKRIPWELYKDVTDNTPAKLNPNYKKGRILGAPADGIGMAPPMPGVGYIANQRRGLYK